MSNKKNLFVLGAVVALFFMVPLTIFILQVRQENRSHAQKASVLFFNTETTSTSPIMNVKPGDTIHVDMYVDPGTNYVSNIRYVLSYDPAILSVVPAGYSYNKDVFPTDPLKANLEGPNFVPSGQISGLITIGNNPSNAITSTVRVATFSFIVTSDLSKLQSPTTLAFLTGTNQTAVTSIDPNSTGSENVLQSALPAKIAFILTGPTPTLVPSSVPTATIEPYNPSLAFTISLHGIGTSGDNKNQYANSLSNKNPKTPTRPIDVFLIDPITNLQVSHLTGTIDYENETGMFVGYVPLNGLTDGQFKVQVKTNKYLKRTSVTNVTLGDRTAHLVSVPPMTFVAGDINNDNNLSILDYNLLMDCYSDLLPARACSDNNQKFMSDLNDDGLVNQFDYNLFLRELSVQYGE